VVQWTKEKLAGLSPSARVEVYKNAKRLDTPEARAVLKLIEEAGLPFSDTMCPTEDDPLAIAIYDTVFSPAGRSAAIAALEKGLPPLAGIDPLLLTKLGNDYGAHNMTTATAGSMIAELMRSLGYKETGRNLPLPPGSVAKTGQGWR
jgi:hypothetical protein